MTDKEQIMIDGVDVSGCRNFDKESYKLDVYDCDLNELHGYCSRNNDCYFKQLARKTQECEELISEKDFYLQKIEVLDQECEEMKKQLETSEEWRIKAEGLNEKLELKNTRYRKALEEIEEVLKVDFQLPCASTVCSYPETCKDSLTNHGTECIRFALLKIKDIVKKQRGKNEEIYLRNFIKLCGLFNKKIRY